MRDCVMIGFAVGLISGALIVSNSKKARDMINQGKTAMKKQIEKMK